MTPDQLRSAIREVGLRATTARVAVLGVLVRSVVPISQAEVCERLAADYQDRSTVYRNLVDFVGAGLVRRAELGDRIWRFEYVHHSRLTRTHPHFVCTSCGTVTCLSGVRLELGDTALPMALQRREFEVSVRGVCDVCAR